MWMLRFFCCWTAGQTLTERGQGNWSLTPISRSGELDSDPDFSLRVLAVEVFCMPHPAQGLGVPETGATTVMEGELDGR